MEARKIFKSGKGSYILTLPKNWISNLGLKNGDYVYLEVEKEKIIINAKEKKSKKATISCDTLGFDSILRRIIAYYLAGYDVLRLKINKEEQRRAIAFASDLLIGAEIIEDLGNELELLVQLNPEKLNLDEILEKLFRICHGMLSDFVRCLFNFKKELISSIIFREDEVDRLVFLILRLTDNVFLRAFSKTLERIADHIEIMAESLLVLGKKYEFDIAEEVPEIFKSSCMSFLKKDINLADEILEKIEIMQKHLLSFQNKLLNFNKEEILHIKTIFDSFHRILAYSSDIAENTINLFIANLNNE
ncbi:MAG: phosphate uptake regulator PhoU [Archaeoglobaceae archaeon]|nr:phosphate uptake regulator PhoU [Archaeoglobaceae archaeon]